MARKIVPLLGLGFLLAWLSPTARSQPPVAPGRPPLVGGQAPGARNQPKLDKVSDEQIQAALKRAVATLRVQSTGLTSGQSALVTMALLKSGLPPDTPEIKAGIETILARVVSKEYQPGGNHIYEAGISIMALANADPVKYRPQIESIVAYLIAAQKPGGFWFYPNLDGNGDTSISQYAILGLWEAARSGVSVPKRVWDKAANWHVTTQLRDGSFTYHPPPPSPDGQTLSQPGTHTMTVAGTASLIVCRMHLYPGASDPEELRTRGKKSRGIKYGILIPATVDAEESGEVVEDPRTVEMNYKITTRLSAIDKAMAKGRDWVDEHFTVVPQSAHDLYYLYGLERLSALAGVREYDGHDWYAEGAAHLVATQSGGAWTDSSGVPPATAFGVLFLGKATEKMLGRKPAAREAKFGGGLLIGGRGLPENLATLTLDQGGVRVRKLKGPVDELLAELENAQSRQVEAAQATLVEAVVAEDPEALIGQSGRLLKLAHDKRTEVRRTVFWALGRTNDLRVVPTLIEGLNDPDPDCRIEARNALRFVSKRIDVHEPPDEATPEQRTAAIVYWKKWYLTVRPYDERDDLGEAPPK